MESPLQHDHSQQRAPLQTLLDLAVAVSHASGGAIWLHEAGRSRLVIQQGLGETPIDQLQQQWPGHVEKIESVLLERKPQTLEATFETSTDEVQSLKIMMLPFCSNGVNACVELFLPAMDVSISKQTSDRVQDLLTLANDSEEEHAESFVHWLIQVRKQLDLKPTVHALANETRKWSGWDRVSVSVKQGWTEKVAAVSGLEAFDRRSTSIRELEKLIKSAPVTTKLECYVESSDASSHLVKYAERVRANAVAMAPLLNSANKRIGTLLFERFEQSPIKLEHDLEILRQHASPVLSQSLEFERARSNVLVRYARFVLSLTFVKWFLVLAGLCCGALALTYIKVDMKITGTALIEPDIQQDVFAVATGIVQQVHVSHGQQVTPEDPLITLKGPELEFEHHRLNGELETVQQQIRDLKTLRSDPRRALNQGVSADEIAARGEELKFVELSLKKQIDSLDQQLMSLVIKPRISGQIMTWDLDRNLLNRPVNRVDRLLSIAQLNGPWSLHIKADSRDLHAVLAAIQEGTAQFEFITADHPEIIHVATLREIAPQIESDSLNGSTLEIVCDIDTNQLTEPRPGSAVIASIDCGPAPCGYVWFRRVIDRVHQWWQLNWAGKRAK